MFKSFVATCGSVFALCCTTALLAVPILEYFGVLKNFHREFTILGAYLAPEVALAAWFFLKGPIIGTVLFLAAIGIFIYIRFLIGYAWGVVFIGLRHVFFKLLYCVITIIVLFWYGNFVWYSAISSQHVTNTAVTLEDCAQYQDVAYMPQCVLAVAKKNNNPDLCFGLDTMERWSQGTHSVSCLKTYAESKKEPSVCTKLPKVYDRDDCYFDVSTVAQPVCSEIENEMRRSECYDKLDVCEEISGQKRIDCITEWLKR